MTDGDKEVNYQPNSIIDHTMVAHLYDVTAITSTAYNMMKLLWEFLFLSDYLIDLGRFTLTVLEVICQIRVCYLATECGEIYGECYAESCEKSFILGVSREA